VTDVAAEEEARVRIRCDADIVQARQRGRALALRVGFGPTVSTLVATAISELARNILLYASPGEIVVQSLERNGHSGLSILARDQGPGIPDIRQAMQDGYSTSRRLGLGLPGVQRLMDEFEVDSKPGAGTTIRATIWKQS